MPANKQRALVTKPARDKKTGRFVASKDASEVTEKANSNQPRRSVREAAIEAEKRFRGSMKLLS